MSTPVVPWAVNKASVEWLMAPDAAGATTLLEVATAVASREVPLAYFDLRCRAFLGLGGCGFGS